MRTPEQNIINTLRGKRVLFLENSNCLSDQIENFERVLSRNGIDKKVLLDISDADINAIKAAIDECDAIVFMTQWVYEISRTLLEYVRNLQDKKIVIEVYIKDPSWYYASQHGSIHDVYIYTCLMYFGEAQEGTERFYKLTEDPYWDYKNGFDK